MNQLHATGCQEDTDANKGQVMQDLGQVCKVIYLTFLKLARVDNRPIAVVSLSWQTNQVKNSQNHDRLID